MNIRFINIAILVTLVLGVTDIPAWTAEALEFKLEASPNPTGVEVKSLMLQQAAAVFVADRDIKIDGDLSDWPRDIKPLMASGSSNPEDLSAKAYIAVSSTSFYIAVDVNDEKHYQPDYGDRMWKFDSVQFALDPLLKRTTGRYGDYDHEIGMCFVDGAPLVWRWQRPVGMKGERLDKAQLMVKFAPGKTFYEAKIPLEELWPLRPELGHPIGFSYLVNDSEGGHERDGFVSWSSGIGSGKDASLFGILTFPQKALEDNITVAARCLTPVNPTSAAQPQEWTFTAYVKNAGQLDIVCDGVIEHGPHKGAVITGKTSVNVQKGTSGWILTANLAQFAPARIKMRVTAALDGVKDTVPSKDMTIYVYKPGS